MIDGEDKVIIEGRIIRVRPAGADRYRVILLEEKPHTLDWDCELPAIEYRPEVGDKMALRFLLDEGRWRIYFKLKSAPWVELKTLW